MVFGFSNKEGDFIPTGNNTRMSSREKTTIPEDGLTMSDGVRRREPIQTYEFLLVDPNDPTLEHQIQVVTVKAKNQEEATQEIHSRFGSGIQIERVLRK